MTRGEIRARIITALHEASPSPVRWTADEINRFIDDGYQEMARETGAISETVTLAVQAQTPYLDLPANCLYPIMWRDLTSGLPIDQVSLDWIESEDQHWMRRAASRPDYVAPFDLRTAILFPTYNVASNLELTQAIIPAAITSDATEPLLPANYHRGLVFYGHYRALLKDAKGLRLGRALRQLGFYREVRSGLGDWAGGRHAELLKAISGTPLRTPTHSFEGA